MLCQFVFFIAHRRLKKKTALVFTLSQTCFKLSALAPETNLTYNQGSYKINYKNTNTNIAKPLTINLTVCNMSRTAYQNYKKHSRCIRQSAMSVNSTVPQYVLVNTKVSYPYLSAIPSASFSYCTLPSHKKHTVCLCVSCYYICGELTYN